MKKRLIKENFEKRLNDSLRKKPFRTLHDLLCELYLSYNSCLAGNLSGDPNDYQERFVRLCRTNNLDFETEWDKMEHRHDN
jgi:hypothetical protein